MTLLQVDKAGDTQLKNAFPAARDHDFETTAGPPPDSGHSRLTPALPGVAMISLNALFQTSSSNGQSAFY